MNLNHIYLSQSMWTQSLFRRMKFFRRFGNTGKAPIPESIHRELQKSHLHGIVREIGENSIPIQLMLNMPFSR